MQILDVLKRRFPFELPDVVELPKEELIWQEIDTGSISLPPIEFSEITDNLLISKTPKIIEASSLIIFEIFSVDQKVSVFPFEIIDILQPISSPNIEGTIFVKREQEQTIHGTKKLRTRIEVLQSREKLNPKAPKGLDIFEMLLPVLLPPIATEFSDELFFPTELFPFQRAGVKWLFENDSALLADDMGLGKTVQAITAFRALLRRSQALQALVICPLSVLPNWMRELEKWAPELVAVRIHGAQQTRRIGWKALHKKCHVLVTTYDTIRQDVDIVKNGLYDVIIADEIQKIKNANTATSRAAK